MAPRLAVIDYGIGNLRSAQKALEHLGADARLTADPAEVADAHGVVLPGVGAFGACMRALEASGCRDAAVAAARGAVAGGRPFLGICVGMQMLYEGSDESPGEAGLGVLAGRVERLPDRGLPLPQMGWNTVERPAGSRLYAGLPDPVWVYFVHSYAVLAPDGDGVAGQAGQAGRDGEAGEAGDRGDRGTRGGGGGVERVAWAEYGSRFVASVERGRCWATQFHPEKSSATGLAVLANFVRACEPSTP